MNRVSVCKSPVSESACRLSLDALVQQFSPRSDWLRFSTDPCWPMRSRSILLPLRRLHTLQTTQTHTYSHISLKHTQVCTLQLFKLMIWRGLWEKLKEQKWSELPRCVITSLSLSRMSFMVKRDFRIGSIRAENLSNNGCSHLKTMLGTRPAIYRFYIIINKEKAVNLCTEIPSALEKKQHFNQSGKNTSAHEKSSTGTRLTPERSDEHISDAQRKQSFESLTNEDHRQTSNWPSSVTRLLG